MSVTKMYQDIRKHTTNDSTAAALLTLAHVLDKHLENFDHQICMGIRKGLFGNDSGNKESILDLQSISIYKSEDK